jgi:hypothetical protein
VRAKRTMSPLKTLTFHSIGSHNYPTANQNNRVSTTMQLKQHP